MSQLNKTNGCPSCGSVKGYESTQRLTQYYDVYGKPDGYSLNDVPSLTVRCRNCGKRFKLRRISTIVNNDRKE